MTPEPKRIVRLRCVQNGFDGWSVWCRDKEISRWIGDLDGAVDEASSIVHAIDPDATIEIEGEA